MKKKLFLLNLTFLSVGVALFFCLRSAQAFTLAYCGCPLFDIVIIEDGDPIQQFSECYLKPNGIGCKGKRSTNCSEKGKCVYTCTQYILVPESLDPNSEGEYLGVRFPDKSIPCRSFPFPPPTRPIPLLDEGFKKE